MDKILGKIKIIKYPKRVIVICSLQIFFLILAGVLLLLISGDFIQIYSASPEIKNQLLCGLLGFIGALIASMRKFYRVLITYSSKCKNDSCSEELDLSIGWLYYYISRPLLGAFLGIFSVILVKLGFKVLLENKSQNISNEGSLLLFTISLLSGFSVSHVLNQLEAIAKQIFTRKIDN